jgi:Cu2+-exporting ATPase
MVATTSGPDGAQRSSGGTGPPAQRAERLCFHCGLPIPEGFRISAKVLGELRPMCCIGCCAAAEMIEAQGLSDWYVRRDGPSGVPASTPSDTQERLAYLETPEFEEEIVESDASGGVHAALRVEGLACPACVWVIERHLLGLDGVLGVRVGLASGRVRVRWDPARTDLRAIVLRLAEIGFAARPDRPGESAEIERREERAALIRLGVAGLGAMNVMTYSVALYAGYFEGMSAAAEAFMRWMGLVVTTPVVLVSARPFFEAAARQLRLLRPGMDVPVSLAIGGAMLASVFATLRGTGEVYFDSVCMFTFFLTAGRTLEMRIRHRAGSLTRRLLDATPVVARREEDGGERVVPAHRLAIGDRFRVRAGESVPADGVVLDGRSAVEEALLTGEPWPRAIEPGSTVVAGSVNVEAAIRVEATRVGASTALGAIVALIERAESDRPPIARTADRVAAVFVGFVLGVAVLNAVVWSWVDPERAIWTTLAVLVATCPCALSLATPAALAATTHALAQAGLVVTSGRVIEGLLGVDRFVFDKTGTLTLGRPTLVHVEPLRGRDPEPLLGIAAALERDAGHPCARALVDHAAATPGAGARVADDLVDAPGFGVEGRVEGERFRIGRPAWATAVSQEAVASEPPDDEALVWILLADANGPLAWFGFDDPIRPDAAATLDALRASGVALEMLSGDPSPAAARIADRLGLESVCAGATPGDKVARVRALQSKGERVAVVGDGVNDGPFLRAADVSIAMGSGCDLSRLGADAVLLRDALGLLPRAIDACARTRRILLQNFGWAIAYNLLALPLAVIGLLAPWLAALGMSTSSLVVVANALRLKRLPEAP